MIKMPTGTLPLYQIQLDITNRCNLRCIHCRVYEETRTRPDLPLKYYLDAIAQARELGGEDLLLGGGEPLLRGDEVFTLARSAADAGYESITLLTNGLLVNQDLVQKCVQAGLTEVQVSLDGPNPEVNDYFRGLPGGFKRAAEAVHLFAQTDIRTAVTLTVTDFNFPSLRDMARVSCELGVDQLTYRRFIPQGYGADFDEVALDVTREQIQELFHIQAELSETLNDKMTVALALFPFHMLRHPEVLQEYQEMIAQGPCGGCSAGVIGLLVGPDGTIKPCPHLDISLGNIVTHRLEEIWLHDSTVLSLRNRTLLEGACQDCAFVNVCGGCRAYPLAKGLGLFGSDPLCFRYQTETIGQEAPCVF